MVKISNLVIIILAFGLIVFLGVKIYQFSALTKASELESANLSKQIQKAEDEANKIKSDLDYLSMPENKEKEIRSRSNYRAPEEHSLVLVGGASSTSSLSNQPKISQ